MVGQRGAQIAGVGVEVMVMVAGPVGVVCVAVFVGKGARPGDLGAPQKRELFGYPRKRHGTVEENRTQTSNTASPTRNSVVTRVLRRAVGSKKTFSFGTSSTSKTNVYPPMDIHPLTGARRCQPPSAIQRVVLCRTVQSCGKFPVSGTPAFFMRRAGNR
jgi:hypothetical protein